MTADEARVELTSIRVLVASVEAAKSELQTRRAVRFAALIVGDERRGDVAQAAGLSKEGVAFAMQTALHGRTAKRVLRPLEMAEFLAPRAVSMSVEEGYAEVRDLTEQIEVHKSELRGLYVRRAEAFRVLIDDGATQGHVGDLAGVSATAVSLALKAHSEKTGATRG